MFHNWSMYRLVDHMICCSAVSGLFFVVPEKLLVPSAILDVKHVDTRVRPCRWQDWVSGALEKKNLSYYVGIIVMLVALHSEVLSFEKRVQSLMRGIRPMVAKAMAVCCALLLGAMYCCC